MLKIKELNFKEIEKEWKALEKISSTGTFFQTYDWLQLWLEHFSAEISRVLILGIYQGEELIGLVPLSEVKEEIQFLGVSPVLGGELVSDFGDVLVKTSYEKTVWSQVLTHLGKSPFKFDFVREDSSSYTILSDLKLKSEITDVAPIVKLPQSWEEYLLVLDRHSRHELMRKIRKLEQAGEVELYKETNSGEFFRLMSDSSEQKRNFLSASMKDFFGSVFQTFVLKGQMRVYFLRLAKINIAAATAFVYRQEVLLYNSGFDQNFASLSPGLILKSCLIKEAIKESLKTFDFLRGRERYKYDLGGKERKLYRFSS